MQVFEEEAQVSGCEGGVGGGAVGRGEEEVGCGGGEGHGEGMGRGLGWVWVGGEVYGGVLLVIV